MIYRAKILPLFSGALLLLWLAFSPAAAHAALTDCLSEPEFEKLAAEIAPKVNLFAAAWQQDPEAEFFGGTTRDYLYWLKGKFRECGSKQQAQEILEKLRAEPVIDVREFIIGDSDVDIVSAKGVRLNAESYGVKKQDSLPPDIFKPDSDRGKNEAVQGYVPAEKVRLRKNGILRQSEFGDGLKEIYTGKLTAHFTPPEVFATGHYAKQGINHPILLALRYLRLAGINYYQTYGKGVPDKAKLFDLDPASVAEVKRVIAEAAKNETLKPFLEKEQFRNWLNGAIQKAFRSYTNPTAAMELMKEFRVTNLQAMYPGIEPMNQYLFAQHREPAEIAKNLAKHNSSPEKLYQSPKDFFPDGYFYHGTRTEEGFRGILIQGTLPSEGGSAGAGLYGVAEANKSFSEDWAGDPKRLVRLPVKPDAKIVDITRGEGKRLFEAFGGNEYEKFAQAVGADILRYPYNSTDAFVVKNSNALGKAEGVYRKVMFLSDAKRVARAMKTTEDFLAFGRSFGLNSFSEPEIHAIMDELPNGWQELVPSVKHPRFQELSEVFYRPAGVVTKVLLEKMKPYPAFLRKSLAEVSGVQDVEALRLFFNPLVNHGGLIPEKELARFMEKADQRGWLAWGPKEGDTAATLTKRFFDLSGTSEFSDAMLEQLKPRYRKAISEIDNLHEVRQLIDIANLKKEKLGYRELLSEEHFPEYARGWAKSGALNFFNADLKNEEELMDRLKRVPPGVGKSLHGEILRRLREAARKKWPDSGIDSAFLQMAGRESGAKASPYLVLATLLADAPDDEAMSFMLHRFVHNPSYASIFDDWVDYLSTPWGSRDAKLLEAIFSDDTKATALMRKLAQNKGFRNILLYSPELRRAWGRNYARNEGFGSFNSPLVHSELRDLYSIYPKVYHDITNAMLDMDPKSFLAGKALEADGQKRRVADLGLILKNKFQRSDGKHHPRLAEWFDLYLGFQLAEPGGISDSPKIMRDFFSHPGMQAHPKFTEWVEKALTENYPDPDIDHAFMVSIQPEWGKSQSGLLYQEPLKNHPLRNLWLESMLVPRTGADGKKLRLAQLQEKKKQIRGLEAKIAAWRGQFPNSEPSLEAVAKAEPPESSIAKIEPEGRCHSFFQKLLKWGGH